MMDDIALSFLITLGIAGALSMLALIAFAMKMGNAIVPILRRFEVRVMVRCFCRLPNLVDMRVFYTTCEYRFLEWRHSQPQIQP